MAAPVSTSSSPIPPNPITSSPTNRARTTIILGNREHLQTSSSSISSLSAPTLPTQTTTTTPLTTVASTPSSNSAPTSLTSVTLSSSSSSLVLATITLEGYLSKQDEKAIIKGWKKRWFSANDVDFKMFYYKSSFTSRDIYDQVAGNIDLAEVNEIKANPTNKYGFDLITSGRVWYLLANNEEEQNYWIVGLSQILKKCKRSSNKETDQQTNSQRTSLTMQTDSKHSSQEISAKIENDSPLQTTIKRDGSRLSIHTPGAYIEGYLQKQGEKGLVKSWKKRYFVAKGSKLWYYKQALSSSGYDQRAGFIDLTSVTKLEQLTGSKEKNQFLIHSPARTWYLMGRDEDDVHNWLSGLTTLIASISQQPTSTDSIRSTIVISRSASDTTWTRSANSPKIDGDYQRLLQRVTELEKVVQEKDKTIEGFKEKIVKMEDKMVLWNRIAFLNWAEATELEKRLKESEKTTKDPEDEPYLKQIRLLKRQLNEKSFNCQVLETEIERLNAELKKSKPSQ